MRRATIHPKDKEEYFALDTLVTACEEAVGKIRKTVQASLKEEEDEEEPCAESGTIGLAEDDEEVTIDVGQGKVVLYICSATLAESSHCGLHPFWFGFQVVVKICRDIPVQFYVHLGVRKEELVSCARMSSFCTSRECFRTKVEQDLLGKLNLGH